MIYRNAILYATGNTAFLTKVVNGATSTTQLTNANITNSVLTSMYGTFTGIAKNANTTTKYAIDNSANVVNSNTTTYYAVNTYTVNITGTFYYSISALGGVTSTTQSANRIKNVYCSSTSAITTSLNSNVNIVPTLNNEVSPTGTASYGWATDVNSMESVTPNTSYATGQNTTVTFYRIYSKGLYFYVLIFIFNFIFQFK